MQPMEMNELKAELERFLMENLRHAQDKEADGDDEEVARHKAQLERVREIKDDTELVPFMKGSIGQLGRRMSCWCFIGSSADDPPMLLTC